MACSVIFFSVYICFDLTLIGSCFQSGSSDNDVGIKILKVRYQAFFKKKANTCPSITLRTSGLRSAP